MLSLDDLLGDSDEDDKETPVTLYRTTRVSSPGPALPESSPVVTSAAAPAGGSKPTPVLGNDDAKTRLQRLREQQEAREKHLEQTYADLTTPILNMADRKDGAVFPKREEIHKTRSPTSAASSAERARRKKKPRKKRRGGRSDSSESSSTSASRTTDTDSLEEWGVLVADRGTQTANNTTIETQTDPPASTLHCAGCYRAHFGRDPTPSFSAHHPSCTMAASENTQPNAQHTDPAHPQVQQQQPHHANPGAAVGLDHAFFQQLLALSDAPHDFFGSAAAVRAAAPSTSHWRLQLSKIHYVLDKTLAALAPDLQVAEKVLAARAPAPSSYRAPPFAGLATHASPETLHSREEDLMLASSIHARQAAPEHDEPKFSPPEPTDRRQAQAAPAPAASTSAPSQHPLAGHRHVDPDDAAADRSAAERDRSGEFSFPGPREAEHASEVLSLKEEIGRLREANERLALGKKAGAAAEGPAAEEAGQPAPAQQAAPRPRNAAKGELLAPPPPLLQPAPDAAHPLTPAGPPLQPPPLQQPGRSPGFPAPFWPSYSSPYSYSPPPPSYYPYSPYYQSFGAYAAFPPVQDEVQHFAAPTQQVTEVQ
ncbi:hypothetical protein DIPPA_23688 [Diplonema papillatum]|nr:hypothetical protein DIPPA_23688 [Diplonema papillatum]